MIDARYKPKRIKTYNDGGNERGTYKVPITPLHVIIRDDLLRYGERFLTSSEFVQVLKFAWEEKEFRKAISLVKRFGLWLELQQMDWYDIGYLHDPDGKLYFTYKAQSRIHQNQSVFAKLEYPVQNDIELFATEAVKGVPVKLKEIDVKIFEMITSTASIFISAYKQRHELNIPAVARGE